jgi:hypothetical protein
LMELFRKRKQPTEHQYVEERLSAYLDGQLSSQEWGAVDRHLKACAHCRWNLDTLGQTVQWTRSLPTVSVPRVFTIPVPAQRARARRRPWGLPVLQGATVLAAVMFFFVVASEVLLTGFQPALAPQPVVMVEKAPADSQRGESVAVMEKEPAVAAEALAATEGLVTEPSQAPMPEAVASTEAVRAEDEAFAVEEAAETAASPAPDAGAMGGAKFASPEAEEAEEEAENAEPPSEASPAAILMATATSRPTPTPRPTVAPPTAAEPDVSVDVAPTEVAVVQEPAPHAPVQSVAQSRRASRDSLVGWLGVAELALGIVFILLGITTIVAMYRLRRAR